MSCRITTEDGTVLIADDFIEGSNCEPPLGRDNCSDPGCWENSKDPVYELPKELPRTGQDLSWLILIVIILFLTVRKKNDKK